MIISPHPQGTQEWLDEHLGLPTASCLKKIVTTTGKPSASAGKFIYELTGEHITRRQTKRFVSMKMKMALQREPKARRAYMEKTGNLVYEVGLCYKDEQKMFGASPDGLIDPDGGLEIKDAEPHIQIDRRRTQWSGMEHFHQIQGCMYVCDREWWHLFSYCEGLEPIIIRFKRNDNFIKSLKKELKDFCDKLYMEIRKEKEALNDRG